MGGNWGGPYQPRRMLRTVIGKTIVFFLIILDPTTRERNLFWTIYMIMEESSMINSQCKKIKPGKKTEDLGVQYTILTLMI